MVWTVEDIRWAREPTAWPEAPEFLSFSVAHQVEICPRAWALRRAYYAPPGVAGYPELPTHQLVFGRTVHSAINRILEAIADGESQSGSAALVGTLRVLGGLSQVIQQALEEELGALEVNPRLRSSRAALGERLENELPRMRTTVQRTLSAIDLSASPRRSSRAGSSSSAVGPLPPGVYSEYVLSSRRLGWRAVADFLRISETVCEIIDFKTGMRHPDHEEQMHTYAAIWAADEDHNPKGRALTKQSLVYPDGVQDLAVLDAEALGRTEQALLMRTQEIHDLLSQTPPPARPGDDHCAWCEVRQLCDEYWRWVRRSPRHAAAREPEVQYTDVELRDWRGNGSGFFSGQVVSCRCLEPGQELMVRTAPDLERPLAVDARLRITSARVNLQSEVYCPVLLPGAQTEVFLVPPSQEKNT